MMKSSRGFTLIEMMVALSVFAMLLSVLLGGYSQALLFWERSNSQSSEWLSIQNRHDLMRRLFGDALLADYRGSGGRTYPYFVADADSIEFLSRSPVLDHPGRLRPVRILMQSREDGLVDLHYQEGGRSQDPGRGIEWDETRLVPFMQAVSSPRFRYLAPRFQMPPELFSSVASMVSTVVE